MSAPGAPLGGAAGGRLLLSAVLAIGVIATTGCPHRIAAHMRLGTPLSLEVQSEEGGLRELGGQGPPRLLVIWASWCGRCPRALEEGARLANENGLLFLAIAVDADERLARAAARRLGIPGPGLWDASARATSLTGIRRAPTILLIDDQGRLVGIFEGVEVGTMSALQRAVVGMKQ